MTEAIYLEVAEKAETAHKAGRRVRSEEHTSELQSHA